MFGTQHTALDFQGLTIESLGLRVLLMKTASPKSSISVWRA
jgi:hypothetical protein